MTKRHLRAAILACAFFAGTAAVAAMDTAVPVRSVLPDYPEAALKAGIEGRVRVAVTIDADGNVKAATVVEANPPGWGFEEAALEMVKAKKYEASGREAKRVVTVDFKKDPFQTLPRITP
jgi:TonB family protein